MQDRLGHEFSLSRLTHEYRTKVLQLGSTSNTEVAWIASQHVLDELWKDTCREGPQKTTPISDAVAYGCQECGFVIHPGWNGTSLRVRRFDTPSRSFRRRQQRKKKQDTFLREKKAKDFQYDRSKKQQQQQQASSDDPMSQMVLLKGDTNLALDRHHLAISCGRCQAKVRLKGLKRQQEDSKIKRAALVQHQTKKALETKQSSKNQASGSTHSSSDFLQLPPASLPEERRKKLKQKQKKKKAPSNNSKLMTFLSSLND